MMHKDNKTDLERINEAWIKAKKERKLRQQDAAKALGFKNQSSFSAMLRGGGVPLTVENALKMALLLQQPPLKLTPDLLLPYAEALHSLMAGAGQQQKDKDRIIANLEHRLTDRGISPRHLQLMDLLTQLPIHETDMMIQQAQARLAVMHCEPVIKCADKTVTTDIKQVKEAAPIV